MHSKDGVEKGTNAEHGAVCNAAERRKLLRQTSGPQTRLVLDREVYLCLYTGEGRRKKKLFDLRRRGITTEHDTYITHLDRN